jgi:hypothetical protein
MLRAARTRFGANNADVRALEGEFLTPPVRYSRPGLQSHITYLYSMTLGADQAVGHDAIERYAELRKALDSFLARLNKLLASTG